MKKLIDILGNRNFSLKTFKNVRKEKFFIFFSVIAIFIFLIFGISDFFSTGKKAMCTVLFFCSFLFFMNIVMYNVLKKINIASTISLLICMTILSYSMIDTGFSGISIVWILAFPLTAYYFKGRIKGSGYIAVLLLVGCFIFELKSFDIINTGYSASTYLMISCSFIVVSLMAFFYEDTSNRNENIIWKQIYTDPLTGLRNRRKLIEDLAGTDEYRLILINVDDFKEINNIYGSDTGDELILEISERIKDHIDGRSGLYKLHADEFAVTTDTDKGKEDILLLVENIDRSLSTNFLINKNEITISVSIGISGLGNDTLSEADIALKMAKDKMLPFVFFDNTVKLKEKFHSNLLLLNKLNSSIANDNIVPFYQPIFNNKTLKIDKYECLARLFYNDEIIPPFSFLDLAKRAKIYPHITRIIILKSFDFFQNKDFEFSINLSIDDILNRDTTDFIFGCLDGFKNSKNVVFEIVESEKIEKYDEIMDFIYNVKKYGCKIAIDDFGSGYSNFDYILKMNVDFIKIDSSLIKKIDTDRNSMAITETIVDFSKKLKFKTIAEFVHSESVYNKVKELNIDYSQGYYFGEPLEGIEELS
jgi:diguanylate cyclase (GGDEF)-like protein